MSGHDRESGRSEGENDFASLEHLAYLEHTEYRVPMRNSGWGEEEEEREKPMRSENGSLLAKRSPVGGALESFGSDLE